MSQIIYLNGQYLPYPSAKLGVEDRGMQFADAVYEVVGVIDGIFCDQNGHLERLQRSLSAIEIPMPMSMEALKLVLRRITAMNRLRYGLVYFQVSRGTCTREHSYNHIRDLRPNLYVKTKSIALNTLKKWYNMGSRIAIKDDIRWQRCDIKTVGLLANCLAKTQAQAEGFDDAWMIDAEGKITEGTSANAWIVDQNNVLRTRHVSRHILQGITRTSILKKIPEIQIEERPFSLKELLNAKEAFQSSASSIKPVGQVNDVLINGGKTGQVTRAVQQAVLGSYGAHIPELLGIV